MNFDFYQLPDVIPLLVCMGCSCRCVRIHYVCWIPCRLLCWYTVKQTDKWL